MAKVPSRVLVIDASIAMAAGEVSEHGRSRNCREFLLAVRDICHRMAFTDPVREEWNDHESRFATKWRRWMMGDNKILEVQVSPQRSLRDRIETAAPSDSVADIVEKDRPLIQAALATDKRVASCDERVRKHLQALCPKLRELAPICWVNPGNPADQAVAWLQVGAPAEEARTLGYVPPEPKQRRRGRKST